MDADALTNAYTRAVSDLHDASEDNNERAWLEAARRCEAIRAELRAIGRLP